MQIIDQLLPGGHPMRPGRPMRPTSVTVHWTANTTTGADALAHARYMERTDRETSSWHYTVDSQCVVRHIPETEMAWHAGDGSNGPGNTTSIGVEVCVDPGSAYPGGPIRPETMARLVALLTGICRRYGWPADERHIVEHRHWTGKDCPDRAYIRIEEVRAAMAQQFAAAPTPRKPVAILDPAGHRMCEGEIREDSRTWVPLTDLLQALGWRWDYDPGGPSVAIRFPGAK